MLNPATQIKPSRSQQENKKARKEAQKEEKAKALEQKQKSIQQMLAGMSEEEQKAWHEKNKVTLLAQLCLCPWLPAARLLHSAAALSQVCSGAPRQQPNTCCAALCCAVRATAAAPCTSTGEASANL